MTTGSILPAASLSTLLGSVTFGHTELSDMPSWSSSGPPRMRKVTRWSFQESLVKEDCKQLKHF